MAFEVVCAECFEDPDLRRFIREQDGEPGCDFCGCDDAPTADLDVLGPFMRKCLLRSYSLANEELLRADDFSPRWTTYELLFEEEQLELPRKGADELRTALVDAVEPDEVWCEYDPARLPENESMVSDWKQFARLVKYERRFFFHDLGTSDDFNEDRLSPRQLLRAIGAIASHTDLVVELPAGTSLFRARTRKRGQRFTTAQDLGPPPPDRALQSNRMNPPGVPMFYGAETRELAYREIRRRRISLGQFVVERPLRILDLIRLPEILGTFSGATRERIMATRFLHQFAQLVSEPVDRDDRTELDYIPTQVFTEFLRDYPFPGGAIDGVRYRSALVPTAGVEFDLFHQLGANVVLFATQDDLVRDVPMPMHPARRTRAGWLRLERVWHYPRLRQLALTDAATP